MIPFEWDDLGRRPASNQVDLIVSIASTFLSEEIVSEVELLPILQTHQISPILCVNKLNMMS